MNEHEGKPLVKNTEVIWTNAQSCTFREKDVSDHKNAPSHLKP